MKRLLVITALIFTLGASATVWPTRAVGQTVSPKLDRSAQSAQVDALFAAFNQGNSPGVAVLVMQNGEVVHHKGYGLARLDAKEAIGPDTSFDLASTAKPFTAMAVMMLADRGKLSYEDPLSKFFPEFPAYAQKVTVRNLLTHTSGLVDVINATWFKPGYQPAAKEVAGFLAKEPKPKAAPGERFEYNNTGYLLLALIVEKASGQSFAKFMRENIFKPLGMNHSLIWDETKPRIEHLALSYAPAENSFKSIEPVSDAFIFGAKGVISTTSDLIKWIQALDSEQLVKPATFQMALRPAKLNDGSESPYGFGWGIGRDNGLPTLDHPGGYLGYRTIIKRYPNERTTVVILSNNAQVDSQGLAKAIGRIYLGARMVMPQAKAKVDPAVLESYAGKYESDSAIAPNLAIEITLEGGELYMTSALRPKAKLLAQTQTEFSIGETTATVTFNLDDKGKSTSLTLKMRMGVINARRLN